jgi:hypothetical protein
MANTLANRYLTKKIGLGGYLTIYFTIQLFTLNVKEDVSPPSPHISFYLPFKKGTDPTSVLKAI